MDTPHIAPRVIVAGAGIAGIEAVLALRAFMGDDVAVTVVDPGTRFSVPATATGQAFGVGTGIDLRLADVVDRAGAALVGGSVAAVDGGRHIVTLAGGRILAYESLVVAVGARPVPAVDAALTFTGMREAPALRAMIDEIGARARRGRSVELAVVVPRGCGWALAAYEIALMAREHLSGPAGEGVVIRVVTSEEDPLGLFGAGAGATVAQTLRRSGVEVLTGAGVRRWHAGRLELADGSTLWADRVIALPLHEGPRIAGLPCDARGFIAAEPDGRVPGMSDAWAVGDGTSSPVKQGGIACRQADAVAAAIAGAFGHASEGGAPAPPVAGWMWDGRRGRRLPSGAPDDPTGAAPLWPVAKIGGRFLAPFVRSLVAGTATAGVTGVPV